MHTVLLVGGRPTPASPRSSRFGEPASKFKPPPTLRSSWPCRISIDSRCRFSWSAPWPTSNACQTGSESVPADTWCAHRPRGPHREGVRTRPHLSGSRRLSSRGGTYGDTRALAGETPTGSSDPILHPSELSRQQRDPSGQEHQARDQRQQQACEPCSEQHGGEGHDCHAPQDSPQYRPVAARPSAQNFEHGNRDVVVVSRVPATALSRPTRPARAW